VRRLFTLLIGIVTALAVAVPGVQLLGAPSAGAVVPGSVGADAASSWQANATVWSMTYANGDIFMVGDFTSLRPPGDALGTGEVSSPYFGALNASTGALDPAIQTHVFAGQTSGLPLTHGVVAPSPDGSTIYVGGAFTTVDGQPRNHIAAFSTSTGALLPWAPNVSAAVNAIAAVGNVVYIGGSFAKVNKTAVGPDLAALSASTGAIVPWGSGTGPSTDNTVDAMAVTPDGSQVVIGGYFDQVDGLTQSADGTTRYNKAAIIGGVTSATPGALEPMPADNVAVPLGTSKAPVNGCSSDVKSAVISNGVVYLGDEGTGGGCFDGVWAANLSNGSLVWVNRCLGATQILAVIGNYVYKGSHAHNCQENNTNGPVSNDPANFPQVATNQARHLLSLNTSNGFLGPWYPFSNAGTNLGPRAMATDGSQLYVGGDFTTMNHVGQQGIARFTPTSDYPTPKPDGPVAVDAGPGTVNIYAVPPVDLDDTQLTMELFRDGGSTPIASQTVTSYFWKQPTVVFSDSGLAAGSQHTYQVEAVPTSGSPGSSLSRGATVQVQNGSTSYAATVASQNPSGYWRFDEPDGTLAGDASSSRNWGIYTGGVTLGQPGAIAGDPDTAASFDGSTGYFSTGTAQASPSTFSEEVWFKTTTSAGGRLIGFGSSQTGNSSTSDRLVYMTNSGLLIFGTKSSNQTHTIQSTKSYNNGAWHQVVATQGPSGMVLYVDGQKVASNTTTTSQSYTGYWRVGDDSLSGWTSRPSSSFFNGTIDDASVYNSALSATQVAAQYTAALAPGQPGVLTQSANGTGEIDLSWGAAVGATSYDVRRGAGGSDTFPTDLGTVTGTTFADSGHNPGDSFDYEVIPENASASGPASNAVTGTTLPAQVTGLELNVVSPTDINLSWSPAQGAATYDVLRAPDGTSNWTTISSGSSASSYDDTSLSPGTAYDYVVAAVNAGGTGAVSATQVGTTPQIAPGQVTDLNPNAVGATEIDLTWDPTTGASSYEVDISTTSASGPFTPLTTTLTSASYASTGLTAGATYWYQVIASNSAGPGPASQVVSATTPNVNSPTLANNFEGGSAGTALTAANSGGASGNKFDAVTCAGTGTVSYTSSAPHGTLAAALTPGTSPCFLQWGKTSITTPSTTSYGRTYLNLGADPAVGVQLAKLGDSSFNRDAQITIQTNGKLALYDAAGTKQLTFTSALPLNTWLRVEWTLVNSATTGSLAVSVYAGDSYTPLETETVGGINTGTSFGSLQLGQAIASSTPPGTVLLDDVAIGTAGPLGPGS